MSMNDRVPDLADLADEPGDAAAWNMWLAQHPREAAELEAARRVRALMVELRRASVAVPSDFQARLMERIRQDATLLHLVDFGLSGLGHALLELLAAFFALLPAPQPQTAT
jgi:hypothetical protein